MSNKLGDCLKKIRQNKNLKLREVETISGVSNAYISQLETGKIVTPSPKILRKLSEAYCFSYAKIMEMAGYDDQSKEIEDEMICFGSRIPIKIIKELSLEEEDEVIEYLEFIRFKRSKPERKDP